MCGIAGIVGFSNQEQAKADIQKMLSMIEHRGPDSFGLWVGDNFAFGMRRLSIIDLTGGDQPIWDKSGVGIILNGEIYNYKELRQGLENEGVTFATHSDTEVVLQMYLKYGIDFVHKIEGMFAICLYDPRNKKCYLLRDRLGKKPLYYYASEAKFVFASELKSIIAVTPEAKELNHQALWDYLTLRYVPSPITIWEGVSKLEPGCYLQLDLNTMQFDIQRYWQLEFKSEKFSKQRNYKQEFSELFLSAVEKRLLAADVPVGILLSGGLDSSCVAAAAVELGHKNFHTFSIGFEGADDISELKYARQVADYLGSNHHEVVITQQQFLDFIQDFVWYSDEPLADLASIPLFYVAKLAAQHVKVVLSGEGADEILAGYNLDLWAKKLHYLKLASVLPSPVLKVLPNASLKNLGRWGYSGYLKHNATHITSVFSETEKSNLLKIKSGDSTRAYIQSLYAASISDEPLDQLQQVYCNSWLVEDLLMKADKMSMATSLELRVPFLDHKLVEWAARLPLECKVGSYKNNFSTKKILRDFAAKRIPQVIINRPKQGFPVPAYDWIRGSLFDFAKQNISKLEDTNWFNTAELHNLVTKLKGGTNELAHKAWSLAILSAWKQRWEV